MRQWTVDLNERELRLILTAFDIARDQTINPRWSWWYETKFADKLYKRLCDHGHVGVSPR